MSKTWIVIMKNAGAYNIKGSTLDLERGLSFIDTLEEKSPKTLLKKEFLSGLVKALKSNGHYQAFKSVEIIDPHGMVWTDQPVDQRLEVGCILAFTHNDDAIGLLYVLIGQETQLLGLWPRDIWDLYKNNNKDFMNLIYKLFRDPSFFKVVTFLFPSYYPN